MNTHEHTHTIPLLSFKTAQWLASDPHKGSADTFEGSQEMQIKLFATQCYVKLFKLGVARKYFLLYLVILRKTVLY